MHETSASLVMAHMGISLPFPTVLLNTARVGEEAHEPFPPQHPHAAARGGTFTTSQKHGPDSDGNVSFCNLRYDLAWDDGVRASNIFLPLFGITERQAQQLRWMEVFTYTPAMEQVNLPSNKLQVTRDVLTLFYLFWTEEEGFTWDLYDDVCAAIARYTDYEVPTPPRDSTALLKALLVYVKRQVGEEWFKPKMYTPGDLLLAEQIIFGERDVDEPCLRRPMITLAGLRAISEGPQQGIWSDSQHAFALMPYGTFLTMCPTLENEVRQLCPELPDPCASQNSV